MHRCTVYGRDYGIGVVILETDDGSHPGVRRGTAHAYLQTYAFQIFWQCSLRRKLRQAY